MKKEFGCDNCGHLITAISPDDGHTQFFIQPCCDKSLERKYDCDDCNFRNTRYWCIHHVAIVSGKYRTEPLRSTDDFYGAFSRVI
jgi:hypothetical protein